MIAAGKTLLARRSMAEAVLVGRCLLVETQSGFPVLCFRAGRELRVMRPELIAAAERRLGVPGEETGTLSEQSLRRSGWLGVVPNSKEKY